MRTLKTVAIVVRENRDRLDGRPFRAIRSGRTRAASGVIPGVVRLALVHVLLVVFAVGGGGEVEICATGVAGKGDVRWGVGIMVGMRAKVIDVPVAEINFGKFNKYNNFVPLVTYEFSREIVTFSSSPTFLTVIKKYFENTFITFGKAIDCKETPHLCS